MESVERNRAELRETSDMAFARIDARFGEMESRFDARLNERIAELREEMVAGFARLERMILQTDARIDQRFADLLKWSFTFWLGSTITLVGALVVLSQLACGMR